MANGEMDLGADGGRDLGANDYTDPGTDPGTDGDQEDGLRVEGIGQIAIPVEDVERATEFYRDVLGLEHLFSAPPGLAFFQCGEVRLMLAVPEGEGAGSAGSASILYYRGAGLDRGHAHLVEGGVTVVSEPHVVHRGGGVELWMGFYKDSEGNVFALMEER